MTHRHQHVVSRRRSDRWDLLLQFPHRFLIVIPVPVTDVYANPVPDLDYGPVTARERIEWQVWVLDVDGEPDRFEPRYGLVHYQTRLNHVEG